MIDYQYLAGGLTHDPEVRYTPNGHAVTTLNLAQSDSKKNEAGEWETTRNRYIRATIWDSDRAKWSEILGNLPKGTRLVLHGKLITNQWEKDGQKRSQLEFQAQHAYIDPTRTNTTPTNSQTNVNWGPSVNQQGNNNQATGWAVQDSRGGFEQPQQDGEPPF